MMKDNVNSFIIKKRGKWSLNVCILDQNMLIHSLRQIHNSWALKNPQNNKMVDQDRIGSSVVLRF